MSIKKIMKGLMLIVFIIIGTFISILGDCWWYQNTGRYCP